MLFWFGWFVTSTRTWHVCVCVLGRGRSASCDAVLHLSFIFTWRRDEWENGPSPNRIAVGIGAHRIMGSACSSLAIANEDQHGWELMAKDERLRLIDTEPGVAGRKIDMWFEYKWLGCQDTIPEIKTEELGESLPWINFFKFQDQVFSSRDKTFSSALARWGNTNKVQMQEFVQEYIDHLVRMCELVNPHLLEKENASAAHVLPNCAGRASLYGELCQQLTSYMDTLGEYGSLTDSMTFKQNQLKTLLALQAAGGIKPLPVAWWSCVLYTLIHTQFLYTSSCTKIFFIVVFSIMRAVVTLVFVL